jgi:hypothetical protein
VLAGLPPRHELAYRLALVFLSEHCRGDAAWKRPVSELQRRVGPAELARILDNAEKIADDLIGSAS